MKPVQSQMTWTAVAPMIAAILSSNPSNPVALEELSRMAALADLYVLSTKEKEAADV